MKYLSVACFTLWSLANIAAAAALALIAYALLGLRYDEMHTISTAHDPDPNLTRETVVQNVLTQTGWVLVPILALGVMFWALNCGIHHQLGTSSKYGRVGLWVACLCVLVVLAGVAMADQYCLDKYPEPL